MSEYRILISGKVRIRLTNIYTRVSQAPELELLLQYDFGRCKTTHHLGQRYEAILTLFVPLVQKTLSGFITGPARLGIEPLPQDATSMPGQSPLPRMITAQCDVMLSRFLAELLSDLFGSGGALLLKRLTSANVTNTHVAYVALRILVEGTIWVLIDKQRRDDQNNTKVGSFSLSYIYLQSADNL